MVHRFVMVACAMVALGLMVASPAQAGGGGGTVSSPGAVGVKKPSTVKLKNNSTSTFFVLIGSNANLSDPTKFGTPGTVEWAKKLGATNLNKGQTLSYPVPAGKGEMAIWLAKDIPQSGPIAVGPKDIAGYDVGSGETAKWEITNADALAPQ